MQTTIELPRQIRRAEIRAQSFDEAANTVDIVWTTGATVRRLSWMDGPYDEKLLCDPENVRLDRLNSGAAFLDTHDSYALASVIGSIVPGSARMANGRGAAIVLLSRAAGAADTVQNIKDGVIRNISAGYIVHAVDKTERDDGSVPLWTVTDWEPVELSAVPVPADPGAQVRAAATGTDLYPCILHRADPALLKGPVMADEPKPGAAPAAPIAKIPTDQPPAPEAGKTPSGIPDKKVDPKEPATAVIDPGDASPLGNAEVRKLVEDAVRRGVTDERERIATIQDLSVRAGSPELGVEHIRLGTSVKKFRGLMLDRLVDQRANDGGPKGTASSAEPSLDATRGNDREAGAAMARRALNKSASPASH